MTKHLAGASVVLLLCLAIAGCGSGSKAPSCESICASSMACPSFDVNNTFGVPPGFTSCATACAGAHALIDAAHCNAEYALVTKCASAHNQCTEDLEAVCGGEGGAFLACLNPPRDGSTNSDVGAPDAGTQACNTITNVGQTVAKTATTAPTPTTDTFTGGPIADGTYVLTAMLYYGTATPPAGTRKETIVVNGQTMEAVYSINGLAEERYTATVTTTSRLFGDIAISLTCFASAPSAALNTETAYTATATELRVAADMDEVSTYTKQ